MSLFNFNRSNYLLCFTVSYITFVIVILSMYNSNISLNKKDNLYITSNICYDSDDEDALPVVDDGVFPKNSIFFHVTTCDRDLTYLEACAVESAAKANPNRRIIILFSGPVKETVLHRGKLKILINFSNVDVGRIHNPIWSKRTPAEKLMEGAYKTLYQANEINMILGLITLYKFGGIYLGFDMISVKGIDLPENFVTRERSGYVGSSIFAISTDRTGKLLASTALREFAARSTREEHMSASIFFSKAYKRLSSHIPTFRTKYVQYKKFYPIRRMQYYKYFEKKQWEYGSEYTHRLWIQKIRGLTIDKGTILYQIMEKQCPNILESYNLRRLNITTTPS